MGRCVVLRGVTTVNVLNRVKRLYRTKRQRLRDAFSTRSYSQSGEDIIVDYVFRLRGIELPSYIDIGANHPFAINNTARFYERGCRGFNIDPNPVAIQLFNEHRREEINLNVGINDKAGGIDFFFLEDERVGPVLPIWGDKFGSNGQDARRGGKGKSMRVS